MKKHRLECRRVSGAVAMTAMVLAVPLATQEQDLPWDEDLDWVAGDVFVGVGFDAWFHPTAIYDSDGNPVSPGTPADPGEYWLFDSRGGFKGTAAVDPVSPAQFTAGCAIDARTGHLWVTSFLGNTVTQFDGTPPHRITQLLSLTAVNNPDDPLDDMSLNGFGAVESVLVDGQGNVWTGNVDAADGRSPLLVFSPVGLLPPPASGPAYVMEPAPPAGWPYAVAAFHPLVGGRGIDWFDISADLGGGELFTPGTVFYTSEDRFVRTFDPMTQQSATDPFGEITDNEGAILHAYALRLLPPGDGSGGLLIATQFGIYRFNSAGVIVQKYVPGQAFNFFSLNLTPDGQSFWTATFGNPRDYPVPGDPAVPPQLFKVHIATGAVQAGPIALPAESVSGMCVKLEYTASQHGGWCFDEHADPSAPFSPCQRVEVCGNDGNDDDDEFVLDTADPDCNRPPRIETLAQNRAGQEGDSITPAIIDARDPDCGDRGVDCQLTFRTAVDLPPFLQLVQVDGDTARIEGIDPTYSFDLGGSGQVTSPIVVRATDGSGASADFRIDWTVVNTNRPPMIAGPPDQDPSTPGIQVISVVGRNIQEVRTAAANPDPDCKDGGEDCRPLVYRITAGTLPPGVAFGNADDPLRNGHGGFFAWTAVPSEAVGEYPLTVTVEDGFGGSASIGFLWRMVDNRPPICTSAVASPPLLWPPNHGVVMPVAITGVTDPDEEAVSLVVTAIRQDEPVDTTGDGASSPDGFGVGTPTARLRAERVGTPRKPGNGRVYQISFRAEDGRGGSCTGAVTVGIPHDMGRHRVPVDDGSFYDSTAVGPISGP